MKFKSRFPADCNFFLNLLIIKKLNQIYILDVLTNGADEFEDSDEIYEAIGEVLHEIAEEKTEKAIKYEFAFFSFFFFDLFFMY